MPGREHVIRFEIEKAERGAFLPTFTRSWVTNGKLSCGERPVIPGYVFFRTDRDSWGCIQAIEGVQQVLTNQNCAMRVSEADMIRMVIGHAANDHQDHRVRLVSERRVRNSSRKPRPGKRIRERKITVG